MSMSLAALRNAVNARTHAPCPMCGDEAWIRSDALSCVPELDSDGSAIEVLAFVCRGCGFVRLYAVQPLETIDD